MGNNIEAEKRWIRFVVDLLLTAIKTGKLGLLVEIALACLKAGLSWKISMERLSGAVYDKQIAKAADNYLAKQPPVRVEVTGYARWKAEQERERFR